MQINSIGQQTNFGSNTINAKKALAIDPRTKKVVASYTNYSAPMNKFKAVLKELPSSAIEQGENKLLLVPKDFGDIICITCKDGKTSREKVASYIHNSKSGFDKVVIEQ